MGTQNNQLFNATSSFRYNNKDESGYLHKCIDELLENSKCSNSSNGSKSRNESKDNLQNGQSKKQKKRSQTPDVTTPIQKSLKLFIDSNESFSHFNFDDSKLITLPSSKKEEPKLLKKSSLERNAEENFSLKRFKDDKLNDTLQRQVISGEGGDSLKLISKYSLF